MVEWPGANPLVRLHAHQSSPRSKSVELKESCEFKHQYIQLIPRFPVQCVHAHQSSPRYKSFELWSKWTVAELEDLIKFKHHTISAIWFSRIFFTTTICAKTGGKIKNSTMLRLFVFCWFLFCIFVSIVLCVASKPFHIKYSLAGKLRSSKGNELPI